jgi:hypothetical protein
MALAYYSTAGLCPVGAARETMEFAEKLGIRPKTLEWPREKRLSITGKAGEDAE